MPKPRRRAKQTDKDGLIEKLLDHTFSLVLSFLVSTGIIGACGYLLFTLPVEKRSVDRQLAEFSNLGTQLQYFNEVVRIYSTGWFTDQAERERDREIAVYVTARSQSANLDPSFVSASLNWISTAVLRLSTEKGSIQGFVLSNETEKSCQQDIVRWYVDKSSVLNSTADIIRDWPHEKAIDREKRWAAVNQVRAELVSTAEAIVSKAAQLQNETTMAGENAELKSNELRGQLEMISLKKSLAITGVAVGFLLFGYLSTVAFRKLRAV